MAFKLIGGICLVLCCATAAIYADDPTAPGDTGNAASPGLRSMMRIYDECHRSDGGIGMCLKKKAITFIDRIGRIDVINIGDGVRVVNADGTNGGSKASKSISENELDKMLPRALDDRDNYLNNMLTEKLAGYISGRKIQISLPQVTSSDIGRGMEEGRGKMKKMMSMMMMGFAMKMAALVPVAIAGLYLLAGKALIVSKIALLLAGIIGIKKLLSSKSGGGGGAAGWSSGGGASGGWQSSGHGGGGGGGGWDRRSLDDAQNLAYSAYEYKN